MALPKSIRKPMTQGQFAKLHEISPDSLSDYKKKSKFWELVEEKKEGIERKIIDMQMLERAQKALSESGSEF
jgi:acid phosphatase class B